MIEPSDVIETEKDRLERRVNELEAQLAALGARLAAFEAKVRQMATYLGVAHELKDPVA